MRERGRERGETRRERKRETEGERVIEGERERGRERETSDEVEEGEALKVLGLLVGHLDDLVVALPQCLHAQLRPDFGFRAQDLSYRIFGFRGQDLSWRIYRFQGSRIYQQSLSSRVVAEESATSVERSHEENRCSILGPV